MYNLHLTAEQLEIRGNRKGFRDAPNKPIALSRIVWRQVSGHFPVEILDQASQMGCGTLALSEKREVRVSISDSVHRYRRLAVGDVGVAAPWRDFSSGAPPVRPCDTPSSVRGFCPSSWRTTGFTSRLQTMSPIPMRWNYCRPALRKPASKRLPCRDGNGWVINGVQGLHYQCAHCQS